MSILERPQLIYKFVKEIFPLVKEELRNWECLASRIPDENLRNQALQSIVSKRFHCQGGSIYALYPGTDTKQKVRFIVAYQTISDYLDNLVDSLEVQDEQAFRQLHFALTEALDPNTSLSDYYLYYPYQDDGGYLTSLVHTCQQSMRILPYSRYASVKENISWLAGLYSNLQIYKHLPINEREKKMAAWVKPYESIYPEIGPMEFAAATGSTLGVFCLYAVCLNSELTNETGSKIVKAYFPWICGLHILLDYFIDLEEDIKTKQLNFVEYYPNEEQMRSRLSLFVKQALTEASSLDYPKFHRSVVQGLLAMYLSDKKSTLAGIRDTSKVLLNSSGLGTRMLYRICLFMRYKGII